MSIGGALMRSRTTIVIITLVLLAAATVLILVLTPATDVEARTVALLLGTTLVTVAGVVHTSLKVDDVDRKVEEVAGSVNGRMSQILDKVPDQRGPATPPPTEGPPA